MRCLGAKDSERVVVDTVDGELHTGDRLLLCSDGLTDPLSDAQILDIIDETDSPKAATENLILEAKKAGGGDNITVITISITD